MKTNNKRIILSQISVISYLYKNSHDKQPRGMGCWGFSIGTKNGHRLKDNEFWTSWMMYSKAVKLAKLEAQKQGYYTIYVLP